MVILVDTNVVLDFISKREPFYQSAQNLMERCKNGEIDGYISFHSVPTIWYLLRKAPEAERRKILLSICNILTVASADHDDVIKAIMDEDFHDFEDCLQDQCAANVSAEYIVTRNVNDFKSSNTPAISPADFLSTLEAEA